MLVKVASFTSVLEAQIAKGSLEAAGISAYLSNEHTINMYGLIADALGGVQLLVDPEKEQEAKKILSTDFSGQVDVELGEYNDRV